ncbi:MAG: DMT family transporter [Acidobacteriota bacterium]|nr:DMT family transporter [Acidobacteriota bacterium]
MTFRKYLVLAGVTLFAAIGDSLLSHGMKQVGTISLQQLSHVILCIRNPWVALGILFLLGFFATYMAALSWADLTYVLPATSLGYVLLALIAKFLLHEQVSPMRWLGILLISGGVGFVTQGPALTERSVPTPKRGSSNSVSDAPDESSSAERRDLVGKPR